jgi:hypothetical protein
MVARIALYLIPPRILDFPSSAGAFEQVGSIENHLGQGSGRFAMPTPQRLNLIEIETRWGYKSFELSHGDILCTQRLLRFWGRARDHEIEEIALRSFSILRSRHLSEVRVTPWVNAGTTS